MKDHHHLLRSAHVHVLTLNEARAICQKLIDAKIQCVHVKRKSGHCAVELLFSLVFGHLNYMSGLLLWFHLRLCMGIGVANLSISAGQFCDTVVREWSRMFDAFEPLVTSA